ncbi:choice-of-anchor M domain-containing protein [Brooklawnia cerclae]|uniref:Surface-anchored protein n=1 Tax=Brooklawnia cerclae TaxID=349934 RepID=A0ABX0SCL1_9ACTN|nr:choice-of-anchor M domain-containing protein [Brooklawnia cerclae]NIH56127.1 surface-anchored protein [Brooklawnia cerclae]
MARRAVSVLTAVLMMIGGALGGVTAAFGQEGEPPAPQDKRVLGAVHTDAIAAFVDDGRLVARTMADVDGELGKRLETDSLIFNLDGGQTSVPAGASYEFLGPRETIWMAPQTQNMSLIWPGFSTQAPSLIEAIGTSGVVGIDLTGFEGPQSDSYLEVFTMGAFGNPTRIYSTKDSLTSWSRNANMHTHVNWAFSDPGRYVLEFTLSTIIDGTPQTATQDYVFFVGDMADYPTVTPTVALTSDPAEPGVGETVALTATVAPAEAEGYVEFFDGSTSLGWETVEDGQASLSDVALSVGGHSLTANFTPRWSQESAAAQSDAINVQMPGATLVNTAPPSISGTPAVGGVLTASEGGWTPAPDSVSYQWLRDGHPVTGATGATYTPGVADAGATISAAVTLVAQGYEDAVATTEGVVIDRQPLIDPPASPAADELDDGNHSGLRAVVDEGTVTIRFADGAVTDGDWVYLHGYSEPVDLGWHQVRDGAIVVDVSGLTPGEHRIAVQALDGGLIGWVGLTVVKAPEPTDSVPSSPVSSSPTSSDPASSAPRSSAPTGADGRPLPQTGLFGGAPSSGGGFVGAGAGVGAVLLLGLGAWLVVHRRTTRKD